MSRIAAIGERELLDGYALAGVVVYPAADIAAARRAWAELGGDAGLLILTPAAEAALSAELAEAERIVWAVIPA